MFVAFGIMMFLSVKLTLWTLVVIPVFTVLVFVVVAAAIPVTVFAQTVSDLEDDRFFDYSWKKSASPDRGKCDHHMFIYSKCLWCDTI